MNEPDVIDRLAGLAPASKLAAIRHRKPVTREQAQASHRALFEPAEPGDVTVRERFAVAAFVAGLHARDEVAAFYASGLERNDPSGVLVAAIAAEIAEGRAVGPYGAWPKGPLSAEDLAGPLYHVAESRRAVLGAKMTAALIHAHLLMFHPRDASPASLQCLLDAGWSTTGIVTISQLVAFLAFQIRAVAGLRVLAAASA